MKKILIILVVFHLCATFAVAQADYKMAGPYEVVARDGLYGKTKGGSERDMKTALDCGKAGYTGWCTQRQHLYILYL